MEVNSNSMEFVNSGRSKLVQRRIETPSGASRKQVRCDFCKKKFATVRGKHIHENRIHPVEYHKARAGLPSSKARWTEEEYCMLAAMEAEMIRNGIHNVNKEIHERFKHSTLNAIKSQRLADKYKAILERYLTCSTITTLTETSIPTVNSCQDSCPAEEGTHHITNLDDTESWKALAKTELNLGRLHKNRINISLQQQLPTLDVDIIMRTRNKPQYRKLLSNMITSDVKADFKAKPVAQELIWKKLFVCYSSLKEEGFYWRMTSSYRSLTPMRKARSKGPSSTWNIKDGFPTRYRQRGKHEEICGRNVNSETRKKLNPILANLSEQQTINQKEQRKWSCEVCESSTNV